jgi:7-cyano-7-deazaguanine synthase in queuosine biosynthesis
MQWSLIARVREDDAYMPELGSGDPRVCVDMRQPHGSHSLGPDIIARIAGMVGRTPTDLACDFLTVCSAAYAADLSIPRVYAANRWERDILLHVPVGDPNLWNAAGEELCGLLRFLTGDAWDVQFRATSGVSSPPLAREPLEGIDTVCLFSGGLDSLVGAIDLLAENRPVALVGHYGSGQTNPVQQRVLRALRGEYGSAIHDFTFYVQPPKTHAADEDTTQKDGETSMRSRSVMFLALGAAVASALGPSTRLIVAENGLISLNVPLTTARMGSFSTRTTHPYFIASFRELLAKLGMTLPIVMPYCFNTKGEMLQNVKNPLVLAKTAPLTVSCSHPDVGRYRNVTPGGHCGYCIPCLIRRAALRAARFPDDEYLIDILTDPPGNDGGSARDLRAMTMALQRLRAASNRDIVASVISTGPLPPNDVSAYVDVYRRGMNEVAALLGVKEIL